MALFFKRWVSFATLMAVPMTIYQLSWKFHGFPPLTKKGRAQKKIHDSVADIRPILWSNKERMLVPTVATARCVEATKYTDSYIFAVYDRIIAHGIDARFTYLGVLVDAKLLSPHFIVALEPSRDEDMKSNLSVFWGSNFIFLGTERNVDTPQKFSRLARDVITTALGDLNETDVQRAGEPPRAPAAAAGSSEHPPSTAA